MAASEASSRSLKLEMSYASRDQNEPLLGKPDSSLPVNLPVNQVVNQVETRTEGWTTATRKL